MQKLKEVAKLIAAIIGGLATAGTTLIPADWSPWLGLVLAVATSVAVYAVPNAPQE